ncbi:hypothetical protein DdX_18724 [Ditylenchus destructor]|uniref:Uncharacterized protein n=1 Tax=Ditylenchus destructor TaxID=166010 RepID=A0AAD4QXW4_9BILA|nr:hypothetical protein DdX_18724 [Ditylenchus destructor]
MNFVIVVILISLVICIAAPIASPPNAALFALWKELFDMFLKNVNHQFNPADFLVKDEQVTQVKNLSISCWHTSIPLLKLFRGVKNPSDINKDQLNDNANKSYEVCLSLMNHLRALEVGKQITAQKKEKLEKGLELVLDQISAENSASLIKLQQHFSDALSESENLEVGNQVTEETKKVLKGKIQSAMDTLKDISAGPSAIAKKVVQMKNIS